MQEKNEDNTTLVATYDRHQLIKDKKKLHGSTFDCARGSYPIAPLGMPIKVSMVKI